MSWGSRMWINQWFWSLWDTIHRKRDEIEDAPSEFPPGTDFLKNAIVERIFIRLDPAEDTMKDGPRYTCQKGHDCPQIGLRIDRGPLTNPVDYCWTCIVETLDKADIAYAYKVAGPERLDELGR